MIKNDIKVIKSALIGEELFLPKKQLLNNTIKINSNRNLNIESSSNICDYKLNCYTNIFDNFEIYFNSVFSMTNLKENLFDHIKQTSFRKIKFQNDLDVCIEKIREFYKKTSIKEEIFSTHLLNKQSINFGKVSNYFFNKILLGEKNSSYREDNVIGKSQDTYFEFFNNDFISIDNLKDYFLLDISNVYDENNSIANTNSININTYICQNLINISRSLFTLHSGTLESVSTSCFTNIADENLNLICTTSEKNEFNVFDYVNYKSMSFDYNSFYNKDYTKWKKSRQTYESINQNDAVAQAQQSSSNYSLNMDIDAINIVGNEASIINQKKLNVSNDTFILLDNSISSNIQKHLKIYNEFYRLGSKISENGHVDIDQSNPYGEYMETVKELMFAFTDIYNVNLTAINSGNNSYINKWLFMQGKLKGNSRFKSDLNITDNNFYDSINFESITSKYLEEYQNTREIERRNQEVPVNEEDQLVSLDLGSEHDSNVEETRLLREVNSEFTYGNQWNDNKEEIFYSALDDRYGNMSNFNASSIALNYLSYNITSNQSMIYYSGRPIYEIITPDFNVKSTKSNAGNDFINDNNFRKKVTTENSYNIFSKDLINTRIKKGSNYLALKADCLVKKTKVNSLKKSNIDLTLFEDILKKVNEKSTKNKLISYSNDVDSNILLSEPDDKLFNLLFAKDDTEENKFYSKFSVTHKEEGITKFSNFLELIKNKVELDDNIEKNKETINNILKNYYKGKYFKTSSGLVKNIISDIIKEAKNQSVDYYNDNRSDNSNKLHKNYYNIALCQYLYLYFFKTKSEFKNNSDAYSLVAKRFIKKTIQNSVQYSGSKEFKEFKFNLDKLNLSDFKINKDDSSEVKKSKITEFEKRFYSQYFGTSESLKTIKNNVFSSKNFNRIKQRFKFEKVQNISIKIIAQNIFDELVENLDYSDMGGYRSTQLNSEYQFGGLDERLESEDILERLRGDAYKVLIDKISESLHSSNIEVCFNLIQNVLPFRYFFKDCRLNTSNHNMILESSGELIAKDLKPFKYNTSTSSVPNITKKYHEGNICVNYDLQFNKSTSRENYSHVIEDYFDEIFDNIELENLAFNSISSKILDMILTIDNDFRKKDFKNEEDVDNFLEENNYLIELVVNLLEVYGEIYCFYIDTLNQESTLRFLSHSSNDEDAAFGGMLQGAEYAYGFSLNYFNRGSKWKREWSDDLLNIDISKNSIIELQRLHDYYNENSQDFIKGKNTTISSNKLNFSKDLEKVLKTLTTSDICQSISFDFLMQSFNFYIQNNKKISYLELKNEVNIDNSDFNVENIITNVFNTLYMNSFYNKKLFLKEYNDLFNNNIEDLNDINSLLNINIFDIEKQKEIRKINSLKVYPVNRELLNSDFYSYVVNLSDLKELNYDSLIKLKIELIDHSRLDRIFLPKIMYFSPLLFSSDIFAPGTINNNGKIGVYDISEYSDNRLKYFDLEKLKNEDYFKKIIVDKFNIDNLNVNNLSNDNKRDLIIEEIFENHTVSNSIENIIDIFYNIKLDEKQISSKISSNIYNMFRNLLNNHDFFDLFNTNKDKFFESCFLFINEEDCYEIKSIKTKYDKIVMFFKYLNNIVSQKNDSLILSNIENYVNLNFNILTNEFVFILNNGDLSLENNDDNTSLISISEISNIDIIKYYSESIDTDSITEYGLYRFGNIENIDNYSISINAEVL